MTKQQTTPVRKPAPCLNKLALSCLLGLTANMSGGAEIPLENKDLQLRWDNTIKYSATWRLDSPSTALTKDVNLDDGDRNFDRGLVSNRLDLFSELDLVYRGRMGLRLSGAAWYDEVYNRSNDNDSDSVNTYSVRAGKFSDDTRDIMGRKAELLDAFVFLKNDPMDETPYTVRLGRHTVLYGESLFFGDNGIANAQAPMDMIKLLSVPGSQFKEIIRPVGQISAQIQLTPTVSIGGYYQYRWEKARLPASGSYLSDSDVVGDGAERFLVSTSSAGPAFFITEKDARDSGQGGIQIRFRPSGSNFEYGLYAARYHDKLPQLYVRPSGNPPEPGTLKVGELQTVYAEKVNTFGASFSTVLGDVNVAGEMSMRTNAPLVSNPQVVLPGVTADGRGRPLFAVGKTAHAQVSAIALMPESALWDAADFLGEIAWNRTLSVDKNRSALDPNTTRDAWAMRFVFTPQYFQVKPNLDISIPIGLGYNIEGRSSAVSKFNGGAEHAGDISLGVKFEYRKQVKGGLNFTHYFGSEGAFLTPTNAFGSQVNSFRQSLKDRNFVSFTVQTTF